MPRRLISGKAITELYKYLQSSGGSYNTLKRYFHSAEMRPSADVEFSSTRAKDKFLDEYIQPLLLDDPNDVGKLINFIEQAIDFTSPDAQQLRRALHGDGWQVLGEKVVQVGHAVEEIIAAMHNGQPLDTIQREVDRAKLSIENDPADALTAASSMIEATYKFILYEMSQPLPNIQDIRSLSKVVHPLLNISPEPSANEDFRAILQGTISIAHGIGSLRTKIGDAHGAAPLRGEPLARHARLAVNAAGAVCIFLIEAYEER